MDTFLELSNWHHMDFSKKHVHSIFLTYTNQEIPPKNLEKLQKEKEKRIDGIWLSWVPK